MTHPQTLDRRLDAIAILEASLHNDEDGLAVLLAASDDPDHWCGVVSVLTAILIGLLRQNSRDPDALIARIRELTLTGKIGEEP